MPRLPQSSHDLDAGCGLHHPTHGRPSCSAARPAAGPYHLRMCNWLHCVPRLLFAAQPAAARLPCLALLAGLLNSTAVCHHHLDQPVVSPVLLTECGPMATCCCACCCAAGVLSAGSEHDNSMDAHHCPAAQPAAGPLPLRKCGQCRRGPWPLPAAAPAGVRR